MHRIYSTRGLVIASAISGEADRRLLLFTRDFGLISATAQGVRLAKSKLKPHIELFSESRLSLVLGKGGWRLVGAALGLNHFRELRHDKRRLAVVQRVFSLLRKLLADKDENKELYDIVSSGLKHLKIMGDSVPVAALETLLVLRILHNLGYVGADPVLQPFLEECLWSDEILAEASKDTRNMVRAVNRSFREGMF